MVQVSQMVSSDDIKIKSNQNQMKGLTVFPSHQNLSMLLAYQSPCRPRQNLLPFLKYITEIHQNKRSVYRNQHIFNWKLIEPSILFFEQILSSLPMCFVPPIIFSTEPQYPQLRTGPQQTLVNHFLISCYIRDVSFCQWMYLTNITGRNLKGFFGLHNKPFRVTLI